MRKMEEDSIRPLIIILQLTQFLLKIAQQKIMEEECILAKII